MSTPVLLTNVLAIIILIVCSVPTQAGGGGKSFVYDHSGKGLDPSHWWKISHYCKDSKSNRPSPTAIRLNLCSKSDYGSLSPIRLSSDWNKKVNIVVMNNGHSITAYPDASARLLVSGGNLKDKFEVVQFHFHWGSVKNMEEGIGSEHVIYSKSGRKLPSAVEIHIVCKKQGMSFNDAVSGKPDNLAVLAGFIAVKSESSKKIDSGIRRVLRKILRKSNEFGIPGEESKSEIRIKFRNLLPRDITRFVNYDGALTTPDCNPVVQWHLFTNTMKTNIDDISKLTKIFEDKNKKVRLENNFRPLQNWHGRQLRCSYAP